MHPRQALAMLAIQRPDLINASLSLRDRRIKKGTIAALLAKANGSDAFVHFGTPGACTRRCRTLPSVAVPFPPSPYPPHPRYKTRGIAQPQRLAAGRVEVYH